MDMELHNSMVLNYRQNQQTRNIKIWIKKLEWKNQFLHVDWKPHNSGFRSLYLFRNQWSVVISVIIINNNRLIDGTETKNIRSHLDTTLHYCCPECVNSVSIATLTHWRTHGFGLITGTPLVLLDLVSFTHQSDLRPRCSRPLHKTQQHTLILNGLLLIQLA